MKVLCTPAVQDAIRRQGFDSAVLFPPGHEALAALSRGAEPSWVVGDPAIHPGNTLVEDGGRTLKVPAPFRFYAIRDDHPQRCPCGCGGGSLITFLLPEEY